MSDTFRRSAQQAIRDRLARLAAARGLCLSSDAHSTAELPRLARELMQRGLLTAAELARLLAECQQQTDGGRGAGKIGRYEVAGELARGGGGLVYQAVDPELQRLVAIKVLRHPQQTEQAERLRREARLAARLAHPGIIAVHELGQTELGGAPADYIVMDYVEGSTLAERLPHLSLELRIEVLLQVAQAIAHAHGQGVIHRDLKPANVLMTPLDRPIVTDFGLARELDASTMTSTGTVLGTAHYMAPEQAAGHPVDARADVWALGVMLYEALAGRRPFEGRTCGEVITAILHHAPPPLDARAPRALRRICERALQRRPEERYVDAGELAAELAGWRDGAAPGWRPTRQSLRRSGLLAAAVLVALLAWRTRGPTSRPLPGSRRRPGAATPGAPPAADPMRELRAAQREIDETRAMFYSPSVDIRRQLQQLEAVIDRLARQAQAPGHAGTAQLWATLGAGWRLVGHDARAERALLRAEKLAPQDGRVAHHLAQLYLRRGMAESMMARWRGEPESSRWAGKALPYLERSSRARIWTRARDRQLAAAYRAFALGRVEQVRSLCRDGLARFGRTQGVESFCLLLAWKQYGEPAITLLDQALALRPHFPWAYYLRGNVRWQSGDLDGAIQDYSAALRINSHHLFAGSSRGYLYLEQQKYRRAVVDCTRAIGIDPAHWWAYVNRGIARRAIGDLDGAIADQTRAIALNPRHVAAWTNRGIARKEQGDLAGAIADQTRAVELDPRDARSWTNRGDARRQQGDLGGAITDHTRAIALDPQLAIAWSNRGAVRQQRGDLDGAITDCTRAIELDPQLAAAWTNRGIARERKGDLDGAITDQTRAIALDPQQAQAWIQRGVARMAKGDLDGAIVDHSRAIALDAKFGGAWYNRGLARQQKGDLDGAITDHTRALTLDPKFARAWGNRGAARQQQGDLAGAIEDLMRAISLDPRLWQFWANLGLARARQGDRTAALQALERALLLAPRPVRPRIAADLDRVRRAK